MARSCRVAICLEGVIVLFPLVLVIVLFVVLSAPADSRTGRGCSWFWAWTAAGALFMFSFLSALSIGLFLLPVAAAVLLWVARSSPHPSERTGFAAGTGLVLLLVAYLNQGGGHGTDATPWLVGGLAFSAAGIAAYALAGHARQ